MKIILKIAAFIFAVILISCSAILFWYLAVTKDTVFDSEKLAKINIKYEIFDKYNNKIEPRLNQKNVTLESLPSYVKDAFIAVEDRRFYSHGGVDIKAIARATKNNILSLSLKEGASTISQQLVKNSFLSGEKTVERKMKELKLTLELEKRYTKDEILELYLNTVYFGEGSTGIAVAAERFFGKEANEITVSEAALLAGLINSPSNFNPYKNKAAALKRRDYVLLKMYEQNFISKSEYYKCKNQEISLNFENFYDGENFNCAAICDEAKEILRLKTDDDLSGYKIYTEIDQSLSDKIVSTEKYGINCNYSVIILDNKSKYIVAAKSDTGELKRCPASAAKPWLIYAPAIEEKYITEATLILDEQTDFNGYSPKNYGDVYYGFTSAKNCLAKSLNVPAVKILNGIGVKTVKKYSDRLGISYENSDLSIALGNLSGGVTLKELAGAYLPFSCGGKYAAPVYVSKIVSPKGKVVYERKIKETQVFSDATAYILNDMLTETAISGTAKKLSARGYKICAKTGTNGDENGNKDAYCVCYTPDYTIAVWLGKADESYMDNSISGGTYPAAMCADVLDLLYNNNPPATFAAPKSVEYTEIDKYEYTVNAETYLAAESGAGIGFYFIKGTAPKRIKEITPVIKDYKISYNKRNITISAETENRVYYEIVLEGVGVIYNSKEEVKQFEYRADSDETYIFYLQPYSIKDNEKIYGESIKLPAVNTEGSINRQGIIDDDKWWQD